MTFLQSHEEDFKLLEHYQAFSTEVVRVSLLAIGAVGTLYTLKSGEGPVGLTNTDAKWAFILALISFGTAIAFALMHRYWSTDFLACQVKLDRLRSAPPPISAERIAAEIALVEAARKTASRWSVWTIWGGPMFVAAGAFCLVYGFGCIVNHRA